MSATQIRVLPLKVTLIFAHVYVYACYHKCIKFKSNVVPKVQVLLHIRVSKYFILMEPIMVINSSLTVP